jgi:hypothetical protein
VTRRVKFIVALIVLLALSPLLYTYGHMLAIHLRHRMQEHFAEIHAALSDDDPDAGLTDAQIAARDNVLTPITTPQDMLQWDVLAKAEIKESGQTIRPVFTDAIKKMDGQTLTAKGYMFPLDAFGKQSHFLLSPYPSSCPFCLPAGPNELIEIKPDDAMAFTYDPVTVKGKFELLQSDDDIKQGMFYRMENATAQK